MTTQNTNPFVLPGMGQSGELAQNPLAASMEMMRQAWQGLAGPGGLGQSSMAAPMTIEDLDRRITDLRTVENWLRMNLSMLTSSIQGLEVQRATIATLKSFMGAGAGSSAEGPSPLEVALGMYPGAAAAQAGKAGPASQKPPADAAGQANATAAPGALPAFGAGPPGAEATAQGWWNMLQNQFDTLAAATAATMQGVETARTAAQAGQGENAPSGSGQSKTTVKSTKPEAAAPKSAARKRAAASPKKA
jgi:hypothetical protein